MTNSEKPNQDKPCPEPLTCSIAVEMANLRGELGADVRALTENVKALKASQEAAFARGEKKMEKHDTRITAVERKVWFASGVAATISAAITAFLTKTFGGGHSG